jgi:hypothetical protein
MLNEIHWDSSGGLLIPYFFFITRIYAVPMRSRSLHFGLCCCQRMMYYNLGILIRFVLFSHCSLSPENFSLLPFNDTFPLLIRKNQATLMTSLIFDPIIKVHSASSHFDCIA